MSIQRIPIEPLNADAIQPFGTIVDWDSEQQTSDDPFRIVVRSEQPTGWRLALSRVSQRKLDSLANHPHTVELFVPMSGQAILVVGEKGPLAQQRIRAFALSKPVCVHAGVWHGTLAVSEQATILIAENLRVSSERIMLSREIGATID